MMSRRVGVTDEVIGKERSISCPLIGSGTRLVRFRYFLGGSCKDVTGSADMIGRRG